MSSSEASNPAGKRHSGSGISRRLLLHAVGLGVAAGVSGCADGSGFRPLYGTLGANANAKMAQVEFVPIPGRNGQRIRNELLFKAYGGDYNGRPPSTPRYRMEIAIKESAQTTLVLTDGTSASLIYQIDARFQLIEIETKKVLLTGFSQSRASSERFTNVFSNVRSADEAQDRASKTIAVDLNARIAGFLGGLPA
jgi:LPS-assembly lipoprotein